MTLGILVLARLNSTRLPSKMVMPIAGKPLIQLLSERLFATEFNGPYILATSTMSSDTPLVTIGQKLGLQCFRGSEDDVIDRIDSAMEYFRLKFAVIIEGDELFVDTNMINILIETALEGNYNVIIAKSGPIGSWITGLSRDAVSEVNSSKGNVSTDGWADLFSKIPHQAILDYTPVLPVFDKRIRLTIDYPEDARLASTIYEMIGQNRDVYSIHKVLELLADNPGLIAINSSLSDVYWQRLRAQQGKAYLS